MAIVRDVTAQRALEQAIRVKLVLDEEERIGTDLPNSVIQHLFTAGMGIQSVLGHVDDATGQRLIAVTEELDKAIRDIRETLIDQGWRSVTDGVGVGS